MQPFRVYEMRSARSKIGSAQLGARSRLKLRAPRAFTAGAHGFEGPRYSRAQTSSRLR
jgi:hypothetical protein